MGLSKCLLTVAAAAALLPVGTACAEDAAPSAPPPERGTAPQTAAARPRLVVVISIDQLRADYLARFEDLFIAPGAGRQAGFRWFTAQQASFADAHHDHFPTYTGPGHAVLMTGAPPYKNGIVGNQWFDRATKQIKYCCASAAPAKPGWGDVMTPELLRTTTVGDELETATGGRAKTFSFGLKDRAAILLAGHAADGVFWFDETNGVWETSAWYEARGAKVPEWLAKLNAERIPDAAFGTSWEFSAGDAALARLWTPPGEAAPKAFSYGLDRGRIASQAKKADEAAAFYKGAFAPTPFANEWVFASALRCVAEEKLGADDVPDLLTINLSSNDYVGHRFGPDSAEVLDMTVRTDRALADFLGALDRQVGFANALIVVTADHGVAPNQQRAAKSGFHAGTIPDDDGSIGISPQRSAVEDALDRAFGAAEWTLRHVEQNLYLNDAAFAAHPEVDREKAEALAADVCASSPGVWGCFTRSRILSGRVPDTQIGRAVTLGFHPGESGDVIIVPDSMFLTARGTGTTHGSTWTYDTHVPVLLGGGAVRPGRHRSRASTLDIAPTLAELLGIAQPSGSEGRILAEAIR